MKTFVQPGRVITLTAPYAVSSGGGALLGSLFGIAASDVASGAVGEFLMEGVVTIAKTSALAIAIGDLLYWDDTAKVVNKTSSGNTKVGVAVTAAANPSATVQIRLNGAA